MCIRDRQLLADGMRQRIEPGAGAPGEDDALAIHAAPSPRSVSYTHLRAHETVLDLVCRLLLEKKHY